MKTTTTLICALFIGIVTSNAQTFEWAKSMGGTLSDNGHAVTVDGSGNVYTTGSFWGTVDFDPGAGTSNLTSAGADDIFILKLDAAGNFLWAKRIGGTSSDIGRSIAVDGSGNVHTTGLFTGTVDFNPGLPISNLASAGGTDIFISKLDVDGNFVWAKRLGGNSIDEGHSIAVDGFGNVHTTGEFQGTGDFNPGGATNNLVSTGVEDIFVSKLDAAGNFVWAKRMGGTTIDIGRSIALDGSGNVYTTGYFQGTADFDPGLGISNLISLGGFDIYISKLDAAGNFLWAKRMGGSSQDYGNSIAVDGSGNVHTTGGFNGTVDFDPGAGTSNLISAGTGDIFVSKLDIAGNFLWAKRMGGALGDRGESIALDAYGGVYTTGYFSGTADFDPGAGTSNLTSAGGLDIFISKLDAAGNVQWAMDMGGTSSDYGSAITEDILGNVYTTGYFKETADFDPGLATSDLTSVGDNDVFIVKFSQCFNTASTDVITACDSYTWPRNNITYTSSTNAPTVTLTNAGGCDSLVTLNLTINNSNTGIDVQAACYTYTWPLDGNTYTSSTNSPTFTLTNAAGCDSIVTLNLTINDTTTGIDVQAACYTYTWPLDGNTYTSSTNTPTVTLTNTAGCDSIVTLNLTINDTTTGIDVLTACDSLIWIDGITYTASDNTATHTLTNAAGCDSIVTLNLTINYSTTGTDVQTACDSLIWIDGITYTANNNTAMHTLTNAAGCDSVVTLNLTVNYSSTGTDVQTACDSYTWIDGNTYTASDNTATHTLTNAVGCDSVVTLNLTINYSTPVADVQVACDSYTWPVNGLTYTSSTNTPSVTFTNAAGCDSVVTLNLTINNSYAVTDVQVACDTYTWPLNGLTYTSSTNTPSVTLTSVAGCDSLVTLNLTINNSTTGTDVQTACDSYVWINGSTYTMSNNTATHTLTNAVGCDSIVTLNLTVNYSTTGTDVQTACDSYMWINGSTYTTSNNTATHLLTNAAGCDSLVTLNLTINNSTTGTDVQTACTSYTWIDGNTYTTSNNTATHTLTNDAGCDSVITLNLTINTVNIGVTNSFPTLTANATGANYQWLDCDDNFAVISGATGQVFTATVNGNYAVEVTENGCTDTSACEPITNIGILENSFGNSMTVYPNPTSGELSIDIGENYNDVTVIVRNQLGQEVLKKSIEGSNLLQLNIPGEVGMYFIEVSSDDKKAILKVVKE